MIAKIIMNVATVSSGIGSGITLRLKAARYSWPTYGYSRIRTRSSVRPIVLRRRCLSASRYRAGHPAADAAR